MAYPSTPLPVEVALNIAGTWVDATTTGNGVLHRDPITVTAGRADWASNVDPARASFTLRDADGRWSPDNQAGPYWGNLRRNLPCRVGVGLGTTYLEGPGVIGKTVASTPNVAALSFSTAHDVRIELQLDADLLDVATFGFVTRVLLADKSTLGGTDGWSWAVYRSGTALHLEWLWYDAGGVQHVSTTASSGASLPYWVNYRPVALRTTWDPATGTTTFYYSTSLAGSWTQIGSPVVTGATTLKTNTTALTIAGNLNHILAYTAIRGRVTGFELRNGIGGTLVANPLPSGQAVGATTWTDGPGRVWTVGSGGRITNMRWRFHGEAASLPVRWDLSGADLTAPMEATGIFRRLRQGARPLESAYRRAVLRSVPTNLSLSTLDAYWPLEETGDQLTSFGAAIGTAPMAVLSGGYPTAATDSSFVASAALPQLGTTTWQALPATATVGDWQLRWLMSIPSNLTGTDVSFLRVQTSDLLWELQWRTDGAMKAKAYRGSTAVYDSGYAGFGVTGQPVRVHLSVAANGANVDLNFQTQVPGGTPGGVIVANAVAGSPGVVQAIRFNPEANMGATAIGHVTLNSAITDPSTDLAGALNGWQGETAARRVERLCREEGIATRIKGDPDDSEAMGPQSAGALMALLEECAAADGGILCEARESPAVAYRTRVAMQAQTALALNYGAGNLAGTLDIDRDDQGFANDITVRSGVGTTGRAELADGSALSVSEPPTGAGRYPTSYDANCQAGRAQDLAGWRLRLSAVNEPAVGRMALDTNLPTLVASSTLTESVLALALGDLVSVSALPSAVLGSTVVRQIMQGTRESITMFGHRIELNTTPASPWDVLAYDGASTRYDTELSSLAASATAGATSLSVATSTGPLWTTAGADLPFDIDVGGVRVTVTAISGAASPQTFTVTATSRALTANTIVRLADPTYYEL